MKTRLPFNWKWSKIKFNAFKCYSITGRHNHTHHSASAGHWTLYISTKMYSIDALRSDNKSTGDTFTQCCSEHFYQKIIRYYSTCLKCVLTTKQSTMLNDRTKWQYSTHHGSVWSMDSSTLLSKLLMWNFSTGGDWVFFIVSESSFWTTDTLSGENTVPAVMNNLHVSLLITIYQQLTTGCNWLIE